MLGSIRFFICLPNLASMPIFATLTITGLLVLWAVIVQRR